MGWSIGYDSTFTRFIGYAVPAVCDHPGCEEEIDRGISYVCGGEPYGGNKGCGLHFCMKHGGGWLCERCEENQNKEFYELKPSFEPKPDTEEWVKWIATDDSWKQWREENEVKTIAEIRELERRQKVEHGFWLKLP
ncbi:MAG: hypothetical protein KME45_03100 [Stenomitos rutilans HA7619-LM2]|jgi:hypothetical protein|nr:hypothetical protein [Stenomitos rutilans HA7619-LM2]MBW4469372.1 hypothetical protein [Stenomitos rutilans HA7619-LM2]